VTQEVTKPRRDELLADLRSARAAQQHLRMQIRRAALLCGAAVVLIGVIATVVLGRRDFQGRPGETQTWVAFGILFSIGLLAAAALTRSLVLVVAPTKARAARQASATATSRLHAFDSAQHYVPTTAAPAVDGYADDEAVG
jgi:hypothetical protein